MNVFDIIGPIMVGPSSSHTAGAVRIGGMVRRILGEPPQNAIIRLHGSFAQTYQGHGTDRALIGGLLGFAPDDLRIKDSFTFAQEAGFQYQFIPENLGHVHPNTALITVEGISGKQVEVMGCSVGGGNILINRVNGVDVEFNGQYYTLIIPHQDTPGAVAAVTTILAHRQINIARMHLYRAHRGGEATMILETDQKVNSELIGFIQSLPGITNVTMIEPI